METNLLKLLIKMTMIFSIFGVIGCSTTACKDKSIAAETKVETKSTGATEAAGVAMQAPSAEAGAFMKKTVKVYKADGTLQCGQGSEISLEKMALELKGLSIAKSYKKNDGLMRIQVCGAPTGNCNVFEIADSDLSMALKKGFKEWTF